MKRKSGINIDGRNQIEFYDIPDNKASKFFPLKIKDDLGRKTQIGGMIKNKSFGLKSEIKYQKSLYYKSMYSKSKCHISNYNFEK